MELASREQLDEDIREFLIESGENLANLDREIVELEHRPDDKRIISSVFRTIHTIKGTCGFFGFDILGSVAHITENILCQVREGERTLTPELISLVLEAVDAIKALLCKIEADGKEGLDKTVGLRARLEEAHKQGEVVSEVCDASLSSLPSAVKQPQHVETIRDSQVAAAAQDDYPVEMDRRRGDAQLAETTIRVDVGLLDKLMNLVGELVLARNQLLQDTSTQNPSLHKTSQRLNLITSELQEGVMKTRMQPIGVVWNKLPRVVRDLAAKCGKSIRIEMEGAGTELDKTIIEAIKDPLTHIVRNSCDHGIEGPTDRLAKGKNPEGLLLLRAYHEGGVVNIEISDDGAGIDPEKVKRKSIEKGLIRPEQAAAMADREARHLIFMPGFSTAAQVTSISGRGVGMDVVKTNIERIGGTVEVLEREPHGTILRIRIPLTLAIIPGLVVSLGADAPSKGPHSEKRLAREQRFVVPQANLLELVRLEGRSDLERIKNLHGTPIFHYRGQLLPLVYLARIFGKPESARGADVVNIVVLQAEGSQMGLVVDQIHDTQEIVVKPLGRQLKGLACYVGATIMGDGLPALILDVAGLAKLAGLSGAVREPAKKQSRGTPSAPTQMLLLFSAGSLTRVAVPLSLVARLEEIDTRQIVRAGGRDVLHYRDDILTLVTLGGKLNSSVSEKQLARPGAVAQVIVFSDGVRHIGVIVDRIIDIVEEAITVRRGSAVAGLLGSTIIGGTITDLLDLESLVERSGESWLQTSSGANGVIAASNLEPGTAVSYEVSA